MSNSIKISQVGAEFSYADRQDEPIATRRNFANGP
jgi:hypothetical protein